MKKIRMTPNSEPVACSTALKTYFGSEGYPPVTMPELKAMMVSNGGPGAEAFALECAAELGWEVLDA